MNSRLELLAARRELLVARGALERARAVSEVEGLRKSLRRPRSLAALAASPAGGSVLAGIAVFVLGASRAARIVRTATIAIAAVRLVRSLIR